MSYQDRYHEWSCQLAAIVYNKNEEVRSRKLLIAAACIHECLNSKRKYQKKKILD